MKKVKILWVIASPKHNLNIEFEINSIYAWLITRLIKNRELVVKFVKDKELRGLQYKSVYVDEAIDWKTFYKNKKRENDK